MCDLLGVENLLYIHYNELILFYYICYPKSTLKLLLSLSEYNRVQHLRVLYIKFHTYLGSPLTSHNSTSTPCLLLVWDSNSRILQHSIQQNKYFTNRNFDKESINLHNKRHMGDITHLSNNSHIPFYLLYLPSIKLWTLIASTL